MLGTITASAQLSSWSWCKGQMVGEPLNMAGNAAPCAQSPAAANQIALIITDQRLFCRVLISGLAVFQPMWLHTAYWNYLQRFELNLLSFCMLGVLGRRVHALSRLQLPTDWEVGDALLPLPLSFLSCLKARRIIILQWFQVTQLEIALKVQNMAPALLEAACFQSEETPACKCHLVFKEGCVQAIGH